MMLALFTEKGTTPMMLALFTEDTSQVPGMCMSGRRPFKTTSTSAILNTVEPLTSR